MKEEKCGIFSEVRTICKHIGDFIAPVSGDLTPKSRDSDTNYIGYNTLGKYTYDTIHIISMQILCTFADSICVYMCIERKVYNKKLSKILDYIVAVKAGRWRFELAE